MTGGTSWVNARTSELAAEGRRTGALLAVLSGPGYRGQVHSRRGDLGPAEAELRPVVEMLLETGMSMWIASAFHMFQDAILGRPGLDDIGALAETLVAEPVFLATSAGAMLLECRGRLRLARGDREGAVSDLRACAVTNAQLKISPTFSSWRSALALALPAADRNESQQLIVDELQRARATGLPRPLGIALRATGMLAAGRRRNRVAAPVGLGACLLRGQARTGAFAGRARRRAASAPTASRGSSAAVCRHGLAYHCGAPRLVARAEDELRAAGAKPRRIAQSGIDALTASEMRVGLLAAHGRSNPEIAQELYVSLKTIETHLSHTYAKLGLSGQGARKRLADALGVSGRP